MSRLFPALAVAAATLAGLPIAVLGQGDGGARSQTDADHYTRYELLAPGSAKFRIIYEVTATTEGATRYFNPIRKGSLATDEAVYDRMTGQALRWDVVEGDVARAGGVRGAASDAQYIMVTLPRAVPREGEVRIRIDKTYEDARSYLTGGDTLVYTRPLGIRRNAVVLPSGYELTSVNYPSQVLREADGRIAVSFINTGVGEVPFVVHARRVAWDAGGPPHREGGAAASDSQHQNVPAATVPTPAPAPAPPNAAPAATRAPAPAPRSVLTDSRLAERAHQDREIVYFLQQPETGAFDLYHDYTESRPGTTTYLNIVRGGSTVSRPAARILDTGEELRPRTLRGAEITAAGIDIGQPVVASSEVVVIPFSPVRAGESVRLRISETYTDRARYRLESGMLVWDRAFGRPANAIVLPAGWALTNCSVPATVSRMDDGRIRLDFVNQRNDEISVLVTAARRR